MKYSLLTALALVLAAPAYAADMTPAQRAAAEKALAAEQSWAGAYVGVTAGAGLDDVKATAIGALKFSSTQFMPGVVAGYRWGRVITFGIEGNGIYAGHSDTAVPGITGKTRYMGDVTAQIGLAVNPSLLVYVGVGPALANSQITMGPLTSSANNFGWVGRAGIDTKLFSSNWALGVSYAHYELGDSSYFGIINASHKADVVQARLTRQFDAGH